MQEKLWSIVDQSLAKIKRTGVGVGVYTISLHAKALTLVPFAVQRQGDLCPK